MSYGNILTYPTLEPLPDLRMHKIDFHVVEIVRIKHFS